jgi:hypothetical protein
MIYLDDTVDFRCDLPAQKDAAFSVQGWTGLSMRVRGVL